MKFYINTIFFLLFSGWLYAQTGTYYDYNNYSQHRVDSLRQLFKETQNDTVRMAVARDLGLYHGESDSDSSYYFHAIELKFAKKLDLKLWMADGNDMLGYVETKRGNYPVALQYFLEAVQLAENVSSEKNIWRITKFSTNGNPRRARLTSLANIYNDFGLLYKTMGGREEKQRELFNKSINVAREINDDIVMSYAFGNLGDMCVELGKIDSAIQFHNQSLKYVNKANFYKYSGTSYVSLGNIYLGKKEYDSASKYFQRTVDVGMTEANNSITGYGYIGFANLYRDTNQPDSGFYYARKAIDIYTKNGEPDGLFKAMESMVSLYRQKGQIDSAFYYQQLASAIKDSLHNTEKTKQFENIGFDQQLKVQELEKEKVIVQNRNRTYAFIAGTVVLLLIGLLLYRNNRLKQKANKILEKTLQDLKTTQSQLIQSEKMASLGELTAGIAHEIQNPLNFVNNFSEVSKELLDEMKEDIEKGDAEEAKEIMNDVIDNLEKINHHGKRADGIVKGMLQHSRSSSGIKELTDINALADEYLRLAYHGLRAKDKSSMPR